MCATPFSQGVAGGGEMFEFYHLDKKKVLIRQKQSLLKNLLDFRFVFLPTTFASITHSSFLSLSLFLSLFFQPLLCDIFCFVSLTLSLTHSVQFSRQVEPKKLEKVSFFLLFLIWETNTFSLLLQEKNPSDSGASTSCPQKGKRE